MEVYHLAGSSASLKGFTKLNVGLSFRVETNDRFFWPTQVMSHFYPKKQQKFSF